MSEPTLRAATREDDAGMRAVVAAAFPDNPKQRPEITAWQYWSNPFGRTCAWVWEDDGTIVATYTNFPMPAVLSGAPGLVGNGVDAAVHPSYQGRRLFAPLARALYADSLNHGMSLTFCFINNPFAIRGTTAAGWLFVDRLRVWILAVDDAFLARQVHLPRSIAALGRRAVWRTGKGVAAQIGTSVPQGVDGLWEAHGGVTNGVRRDQSWWDWRYGDNPDHPYSYLSVYRDDTLVGAAVALERDAFGGRFVYLLELLAADKQSAGALARAAAAHAMTIGAAGVAMVALPRSRVAAMAAAAGFRQLPARFDPKPTSFGAVPNDPALGDLQQWPWSVSWGDLDHL